MSARNPGGSCACGCAGSCACGPAKPRERNLTARQREQLVISRVPRTVDESIEFFEPIIGTGIVGTVQAEYDSLVKAFGPPGWPEMGQGNHPAWVLEFGDGETAMISRGKYDPPYWEDEPRTWRVWARDESMVERVQGAIIRKRLGKPMRPNPSIDRAREAYLLRGTR